jgi:tetratricopeptide (TPR) repeat protein
MGQIFLSYGRADSARAARIARALEEAGHSVWWDQHIHAGSRFSKAIDKALKEADAIVVLWSRASLESAWVHDEAAAGRDSNRLVPVLIEPVEPPLGFRQYQAIDLSRSTRGAKGYKQLVEEVGRLTHGEAAPIVATPRWRRVGISWRWIAAAAIALAVVAGLWGLLGRTSGDGQSVVIVPDGGDMARSQELARNVARDLGRYTTGPLASLTILEEGDKGAGSANYKVDVGVSGGGSGAYVDLALSTPSEPGKLWTLSLEGKAANLVDMRQQAVASLGNVLSCLGEVQSQPTKIGRDAVGLFLNGCGKFSDIYESAPDQEIVSLFRRLTERAPDFAPGWAYLALVEIRSWPSTPPQEHHQLVLSARAELKRARELNPTLPVVFAADASLPEHAVGPALTILDEGLKLHPESALLRQARSTSLAIVGRTRESIDEARKAMELDPISATKRSTYASVLAYAGRTDAAFKVLSEAESIWPGSTALQDARYRLDLRYGDPKNALKLLRERGAGDLSGKPDTAWVKFLEARVDPSPTKMEAAVDEFRARNRRSCCDWGYMQALGTFNRVDEAFRVLESDEAIDAYSGTPDAFFRIHMRPIYSDPRFMRVAQRLGLLAFWQSSGRWPDLCRDPKLPYDCKQAANQLAPAGLS